MNLNLMENLCETQLLIINESKKRIEILENTVKEMNIKIEELIELNRMKDKLAEKEEIVQEQGMEYCNLVDKCADDVEGA